jgi:hypothetical protein
MRIGFVDLLMQHAKSIRVHLIPDSAVARISSRTRESS